MSATTFQGPADWKSAKQQAGSLRYHVATACRLEVGECEPHWHQQAGSLRYHVATACRLEVGECE